MRHGPVRLPSIPPSTAPASLLRLSRAQRHRSANWKEPEMWGIVPAAGRGSRIQPLAFSKELLPVGSRRENGMDRPCAISEYLIERLILGGVDKICFVISPGKSDILEYFGDRYDRAQLAYVVQPQASGLCEAVFRASTVVGDEAVLVGLPDTVWFPKEALSALPDADLSFLLFPVEHPEFLRKLACDRPMA